jgi:hypothetical protein
MKSETASVAIAKAAHAALRLASANSGRQIGDIASEAVLVASERINARAAKKAAKKSKP